MFYCDQCAKKERWPESSFKSVGKCEMCDTQAVCNDTPSSLLPPSPDKHVIQRPNGDIIEVASKVNSLFG